MSVRLCLFAAVYCIASASAVNLPPFFKPCALSDPRLNQCIETQIQAGGPQFTDGIPALGIAPLDPLKLGTVVVNNPSLKLTFKDTVVTGLRGFRLNFYQIQPEKGKAAIDFTANVTLKAHYDIDGQIIILPIRGNGPAKIKITNLNIIIKYDYETKNGHWVVTGYKDSYKMDRAQFKFTNLFGGNKQLAETTHRFTNENWELIMQEIAPPAIKSIIKNCVDVVDKFFGAVPAAELLTTETVGSFNAAFLRTGTTIHTVINENWEPVIRDIAPVAFEQIIHSCVEEVKKLFAHVPAANLITS